MKTLKKKSTNLFYTALLLFIFFSSGVRSQAGASLNFDGINDYVTTSSVSIGNNWTVESWVKPTNTGSPYWNAIFGQCFYNNGQGFVVATFGTTIFVDGPSGLNISAPITSGAWTHVAVTYNNGVFAFYKDGLIVGTQVVPGYTNSSNNFYIGARTSNSGAGLADPFQGNIDELRIWSTTRTQCEILSYMNCEITTTTTALISNYHFNQGTHNATNTGVNTLIDASGYSHTGTLSNFGYTGLTSNWSSPGGVTTGSTTAFSPMPEINVKGNSTSIVNGDVSPTTADYTDFGIASSRTFLIESLGSHTLNLAKPFLLGGNSTEFTVTVPPSTLLSASTGTSNFVVAFTPTSLGVKTTTVYIYNSDCSEPYYTFAITATAVAGAALTFDGVDDFVETNSNLAEMGKGDFTLEAWIKTTAVSQAIITCANTNTTWETGEKCFYLDASGRPAFVGFGNSYIQSTGAVNDGNWHHVAVTWDYFTGTAGVGKIYVDGVNQTGTSNYAASNNNIGTFKIGKQNYNGYTPEAPNNFLGQMDEVRIWNRALCVPELINNMHCELPSPASQTGLVGYYRFNSGLAFGTNATVTTDGDNSSSAITGTLTNFSLSGNKSNWSAPGAVTTGSSCSIYLDSEINLAGNGVSILDGDLTPSTSDNTDFGALCINNSVTRTFTIQNVGTAALTVGSLTLVGSNASSFSLSASAASTIIAGSSLTFAITFTPTSAGTKTAAINISNSDCSESLYDVVLSGTCNALPVVTANASNSVICNTFTTNVTGGGANTYTWTGSIPATNGLAFSPNATANYTVTGTNTLTGCTSTNVAVLTITVNALPVLTVSAIANTICAGNTATISVTGADSYTWNPGASIGATFTPSPGNTTTYSVAGTTTLTGCTNSNSAIQTITVYALPTVTASSASASICAGSQATLMGSGANTYSWNPGPLNGASVNPVPLVTTIYTLAGSDLLGCMSTNGATVLVTVNPLPTVSITPLITTLCAGGTASLVANGADVYTWSPGGASTATINPVLMNQTTYTLVGQTLAGCTSTNLAFQTITVNALPTVTASASQSLICNTGTTSLIGTGADTYTWNPAITNGTAFTPSATTSYTLSGQFTFTGCTNTNLAVQTISVNQSPTLSLLAASATLCAGETATLIASNADTYSWGPGNYTGAVINPSPASTTVFTVTGMSANGCLSVNTPTQMITVNPLPVVTVSASATSVCEGTSVTLSGAGAAGYTWTGGITDGVSFIPVTTDSYTVIGSDANLCTNMATITITVDQAPSVSANITNTVICQGTSLIFSGGGAATYSWSGGITDGQSFVPSVSTSYTLSGMSPAGCISSNSVVVSVTVNALPQLTTNVSDADVCKGEFTTLSGNGALSYTWTNGVVDNTAFSPSITNTYTVTGEDANACKNSATVTVTVFNLPELTFSTSHVVICVGESATLTISGANTYSWSTGEITSAITANALTSTTDFTVLGTDQNGCSQSLAVTQSVSACLGIDPLRKNTAFIIYPNPTSGSLIVEAADETDITVFNEMGQIVLTQHLVAGKNTINLREIARGIYFLNTKTDYFKIIKE